MLESELAILIKAPLKGFIAADYVIWSNAFIVCLISTPSPEAMDVVSKGFVLRPSIF